jgi:ribA/ribD-fused uncharacterized protein
MTAITWFRGRYGFLSNFFPAKIRYGEHEYPTVEHAYQAMKSLSPVERHAIWMALTPGKAKRLGHRVQYPRPDWHEYKLPLMNELVRIKFEDPKLAALLVATSPLDLIEGNEHGDVFWGQCPIGDGENHLGRILMRVRASLG